MARRRFTDRKNAMPNVPSGHWREAEALAAVGFPERKKGEIYVVVVNKNGSGAFLLDGVYEILKDHVSATDETVRLAEMHHCDQWDGWLPEPQGRPWWTRGLEKSNFVAYWVAK